MDRQDRRESVADGVGYDLFALGALCEDRLAGAYVQVPLLLEDRTTMS